MMHSCLANLKIHGNLEWADRYEDVAFNSFPAAITEDFKALRYFTAPNQIISANHKIKHPKIYNIYSHYMVMNPLGHRCCQHNMGQGWPYYAEHLWMASPDNGLALIFYSDSKVTAKVGDGTEVTITENTHYPFDESIVLSFSLPHSLKFPLYFRIPAWCDKPRLTINDQQVRVRTKPQLYLLIDREWKNGDVIKLELPMQVHLRTWVKNGKSISIDHGPLTYSLKNSEKYEPVDGTKFFPRTGYKGDPEIRQDLSKEQIEAWPAYEIFPTTPWNYGLVVNKKRPEALFEIIKKSWPLDNYPWKNTEAPIEIVTKGRRIPDWQQDEVDLVGLLSESPVKSNEPVEEITLIPMGCARLRISSFPVIENGPDGHPWINPREPIQSN